MGKLKSVFLESFAATGGGLGALATSFLIGLAFGLPGLVLVTRENKKPKSKRNMGLLIVGLVLMALGVAFGLGFNAGELVGAIKNQL